MGGLSAGLSGDLSGAISASLGISFSKEMLEAQEQAKDLGVHEVVRNVATYKVITDDMSDIDLPCEVEWEGCQVRFDPTGEIPQHIKKQQIQQDLISQLQKIRGTSVIMSDGTVLYNSLAGGQLVTTFRYGAWVERLKKYSEEVTREKQRNAEKEHKEAVKPFSQIDF